MLYGAVEHWLSGALVNVGDDDIWYDMSCIWKSSCGSMLRRFYVLMIWLMSNDALCHFRPSVRYRCVLQPAASRRICDATRACGWPEKLIEGAVAVSCHRIVQPTTASPQWRRCTLWQVFYEPGVREYGSMNGGKWRLAGFCELIIMLPHNSDVGWDRRS